MNLLSVQRIGSRYDQGVITDIDGNFKLSVQPNAKIQVSFIGYITQTVTVGSQKNIKVTLKEDAQALDEVVVVVTEQ